MSYYGRSSSTNSILQAIVGVCISIVCLVKYPEAFGVVVVLSLLLFFLLRKGKSPQYLPHSPGIKVSSLNRMRRSTFLLWSICLGLISSFPALATQKQSNEELRVIGQLTSGFIYAVLSLGINRKRLHDTENSGRWSLLQFIPVIGFVLWIYLVTRKGTYGWNKYGLDPKGATEEIVVTPLEGPIPDNILLNRPPDGTIIRR